RGQIIRISRPGKIAYERKNVLLSDNFDRFLSRGKHHASADIYRRIKDCQPRWPQQPHQARILLSPAATEPDQMHRKVAPARFGPYGLKAGIVNALAIGIVPGRREGLVQSEPFLRLFDAVVMEFMIDLSGTKRFKQLAPDLLRKLALMNCEVSERGH